MIDQSMNRTQIKLRRLGIAVEMNVLAEADCELRRQMLAVEAKSTALARESAELDLLEAEIGLPITPPGRVIAHGNRHDG